MKVLSLHSLENADHLITLEESAKVDLEASALELFTDFKHHAPLVIDGSTRAVVARQVMHQSRTSLRIVVDHSGVVIGTISAADLAEDTLLRHISKDQTRDDITVMDLMKHRHELRALDFADIRDASVSDIIETLRSNGEQHCLVVDFETHQIRGLIAASDVARRLQTDVDLSAGPSFADIVSSHRS